MNADRRSARRRRLGVISAVLLAAVAASALAAFNLMGEGARFVTWEGIGPDKWSSVWLIRRHVDAKASIEFRAPKSSLEGGIGFDVPGTAYSRDAKTTAFEKIQGAYALRDPAVAKLANIINRIEIGGWQVRAFSDVAVVEKAYRDLQYRFGREQVPFACYMALFDRLYAVLADSSADLAAMAPEQLAPASECNLSAETANARDALVPELPPQAILERIAAGQQVVFLDAREADEFATGHIPGAINLKLRDVNVESAAAFADADLVVPYCVKDFRGFEVARLLQKAGVRQVAIMNPFGIRGWRELGLPVTSGLDDGGATARLHACAADVAQCLGPS